MSCCSCIQILLPAPEKGQIDYGCEGIDELQNKSFKDETLFKALVCFWNLWKRDKIFSDTQVHPGALLLKTVVLLYLCMYVYGGPERSVHWNFHLYLANTWILRE